MDERARDEETREAPRGIESNRIESQPLGKNPPESNRLDSPLFPRRMRKKPASPHALFQELATVQNLVATSVPFTVTFSTPHPTTLTAWPPMNPPAMWW